MSVDILMATYNGEKYLRNQILSLLQQTYKNWRLLIRDDGSTDTTLEIINEFRNIDGRIQLIDNLGLHKSGPGKNFMKLTQEASAKYVIFCDQDDIWLEKKLELLINYANEKFDNGPCLAYCDAHGYSDSQGIIEIHSISQLHARSLREFLFFNAGYQGCSMLFNRALCNMAAHYQAKYFYMHDDVVSLLAHVFGKVFFLPKPLMLYRQHRNNVTGNISVGFTKKLKRIFSRHTFVISKNHYIEKKSFYEAYANEIKEEDRKTFEAYLSYPSKKRLNRIWLVVRHRFSIGGHHIPLLLKTALRKPIE